MLDFPHLAMAATVSREKIKQEPVGNGTDLLKMGVDIWWCFTTLPNLCLQVFTNHRPPELDHFRWPPGSMTVYTVISLLNSHAFFIFSTPIL